jgi:hypothetical protein
MEFVTLPIATWRERPTNATKALASITQLAPHGAEGQWVVERPWQ